MRTRVLAASALGTAGHLGGISFVVAVGCLLLAALRALLASRDRWALRRTADALLRTGVKVHPHSALLMWRAAELTSGRNRKALACSLANIVRELEHPTLTSAVPLNRAEIRPRLELLRALAARLGQLERPVAAQGIVLVEELLTDGYSSPLYVGGRAGDVPTAVGGCLTALDGTSADDSVTRPESHRSGAYRHAGHDARVHSGGSR